MLVASLQGQNSRLGWQAHLVVLRWRRPWSGPLHHPVAFLQNGLSPFIQWKQTANERRSCGKSL